MKVTAPCNFFLFQGCLRVVDMVDQVDVMDDVDTGEGGA